jgi:hypothetical protein
MIGTDIAAGDCVADFLIAHWNDLGLSYIIWAQAILQTPDGQWEPMEDRGSDSQNHRDHVHGQVA